MATNFPNSPSNGDTHTFGGVTYTYNSTRGVWTASSAGSGGGSSTFVGLSDTPTNFTNAGGKSVAVNSGATALEFVDASSGSGVTNYTNFAAFPGSPSEGDLAYAEDTNALYIYNGAAWDRISSGNNELPEFTTEPASSYTLATDGTATTITVAATDPEGFDITYSHDTSPSSQNQATITNSGGTFTITPSTNTSYAGSFNLRFKASDGVHTSSKTSLVSLGFSNEWFSQYSAGYSLQPFDLAIDSSDFIYVVGKYQSAETADNICCISKFNKYGTLVWIKTLEVTETNTDYSQFDSIEIDSNDNIYVAGWYNNSTINLPILVKYNTSGVVQFAKKYVSTQTSSYATTSLAINPTNESEIFFTWRDFGNTVSGGTNYHYSHLIKVDSNGTTQWRKALGHASGNELGIYNGLVVANNYVWHSLRSNVENDAGATPYSYAGMGFVNTSYGANPNWVWMNDAQVANIGGYSGPLYYDSTNSRVVQIFGPFSSTGGGSGTGNKYGIGIMSRASNGSTNTNTTAMIFPQDSDTELRIDSYQEGGKLVQEGTHYYTAAEYYKNSQTSTVGRYTCYFGLQDSGSGYTTRGYLGCPSNSSGGGIYPCSMVKTSEGRTISLVRIRGGAAASNTLDNIGLLSVNMGAALPTSTTLGVNSNITLATGSPGQISGVQNNNANFTFTSRAGTNTSTTGLSFTESALTNTAGAGPAVSTDYEDLS